MHWENSERKFKVSFSAFDIGWLSIMFMINLCSYIKKIRTSELNVFWNWHFNILKHHNSFWDENEQFFSRFLYFVLAIEIL